LQVTEYTTGMTIELEIRIKTAATATGSFADITGMTGAVVAVAGSLHIGVVNIAPGNTGSLNGADIQLEVDTTLEGPMVRFDSNGDDESSGATIFYMRKDLAAGSHDWAARWKIKSGAPVSDQALFRTLQVMQYTGPFDLFTDKEFNDTNAAPAVLADIPGHVDTQPIDSADSVVLFSGILIGEAPSPDESFDTQLKVDGSLVGSQLSCYQDHGTRSSTVTQIHAQTGLTGTITYSQQWVLDQGTPNTEIDNTRIFQACDFKDIVAATFIPAHSMSQSMNIIR